MSKATKLQDKFNVLNKEDLDLLSPSSESAWLVFWAKPAPEGFWALFAATFDEWSLDQEFTFRKANRAN